MRLFDIVEDFEGGIFLDGEGGVGARQTADEIAVRDHGHRAGRGGGHYPADFIDEPADIQDGEIELRAAGVEDFRAGENVLLFLHPEVMDEVVEIDDARCVCPDDLPGGSHAKGEGHESLWLKSI